MGPVRVGAPKPEGVGERIVHVAFCSKVNNGVDAMGEKCRLYQLHVADITLHHGVARRVGDVLRYVEQIGTVGHVIKVDQIVRWVRIMQMNKDVTADEPTPPRDEDIFGAGGRYFAVLVHIWLVRDNDEMAEDCVYLLAQNKLTVSCQCNLIRDDVVATMWLTIWER